MASAERCPSPGPPLSLIVSLQTVFEVHQCGGTLVAEDWVLTSAQCLDPLPVYAKFGLRDLGADINDINGDAYGVRYLNCVLGRRVTGMVRHPGYNWRTLENDVALLRVASLSRVEMASAFVPLVALAGARANLTAPEYVSAGWAPRATFRAPMPTSRPSRTFLLSAAVSDPILQLLVRQQGPRRDALRVGCERRGGVPRRQGRRLFQRSGDTMLLAAVASWGRGCHTNGRMATIFTLASEYRGWMCREAAAWSCCRRHRHRRRPSALQLRASRLRVEGRARRRRARTRRALRGHRPVVGLAVSSAPQIASRAAVIVAAVALASVGVLGCGYARSAGGGGRAPSAQGGGGSPSSDVELMPDQT